MSEENTAEVADVVAEAAPEAAVSSQEQENTRNFESEAREMGWVPETEFKGDKDRWKPAQKFVEDGEKILPIVRSQLKRTQDELAKKDVEFTKRLERMERMSNTTIERLKTQHAAELNRIQSAKEAAVEAGDIAEYRKLDKQERDLSKETFETPEPVKQADPESIFKEKNPWYGEDEDLTAFANGFSQELLRKNPNISLEDNLKQTEAKVKAAFPGKFSTKSAANGHAAVDGGGDFPGSSQKPGPGSKLPPEAKAQAEKDVKAGLYKNVDDWAKVYNS